MIDAPLGDRSAWKPTWPALEELYVPIGKARIARAGTRLTVLTYGRSVPMCLAAADELAAEGIDAEIVDLRSLHPYDWDAIVASVRKTNRVLCVNEDTEITNFGEHLIRRIVEELFYELLRAAQADRGRTPPRHRPRRPPRDGERPAEGRHQGRDGRGRPARAVAVTKRLAGQVETTAG